MSSGLKRIILDNFQQHRKSIIEFVDGVNVICGENTVGKTAVVNALASTTTLEEMNHTTGAESSTVVLEFADGRTMKRQRLLTKKGDLQPRGQTLWLDDQSFPGENSMPLVIEQALNMALVAFDDGTRFSLNIAPQIPPRGPFLIGSGFSAGTRMKILGGEKEQHLFDEGTRRTKSREKECASSIKSLDSLLKEAELQIQALKDEPRWGKLLTLVESLVAEQQTLELQVQERQKILDRVIQGKEAIEHLVQARGLLPATDRVKELLSEAGDQEARSQRLSSLLRRLEERRGTVVFLQEEVRRLPDIPRVAGLTTEWEDLRRRPGGDLLLRLGHAQHTIDTLRGLGASSPTQESGSLVDELRSLLLRVEHGTTHLHRLEAAEKEVSGLEAGLQAQALVVESKTKEFHQWLDTQSACPFAPQPVPFHEECRIKLRV